METKVTINAYQEVPASELNAMQDLAQVSMDAIVRYTLFDNRKYYGLKATKSSAFQVEVATGRGFYLGRVYNKADVTSHSLTNLTPSSGKRIVLAVISMDVVQTGNTVRKFLIDAATRQTQPKAVSTREARVSTVDFVAGTQSTNPIAPAVPSGYLAFAEITLDATGIVDIEMIAENEVTKLEDVIAELDTVNDILDEHNDALKTLKNDLAAIRRDIKAMPISKDLEDIQNQLLSLREAVDLPDMGSDLGLDNFDTDSESDIGNTAYDAYVYRGLQFAQAIEQTKVPSLLTANDPGVLISPSSGLILPKPSATLALRVNASKRIAGGTSDIVTGDYDAHSRSFKLQTPARNYWYYGTGTHAQEEANLRLRDAVKLFNPITQSFEVISLKNRDWKLETINKAKHFYRVVSDEPYWDLSLTGELLAANHVCQTWRDAAGGWYSEVDIGVTAKDPAANIRLYIVECDDAGRPIDDRAIATTTIANSDVKVWTGTAAVWTTGKFAPFYLVPGKRYGLYISTTGSWRFAGGGTDLADQNGVSRSGSLWTSTDGITQMVDNTKDLCFRTKAFQWTAITRYVSLDGISLSGGISRLQAVLTGYEPSGCDISIQAQVGGKWVNIDEKNATALNSKPDVLPLRLCFTGSTSQQPGIWLSQSALIAQRPKLSSTHISTRRTTDNPANKIVVSQVSEDFVEGTHDWTVRLMRGASYATDVSANSVKTKISGGKVRREWTFSGLGGLSDFKIKTLMSTSNSNDTYSVQRRMDTATA
jgi:hypothetical protein